MGYVADFVTGSAIREGETAVAVVIVPKKGGWPDPIKAAAVDPVHAHDRFSPLSLPLRGVINDRGYFEPNPDQLALGLLLDTTGFETWSAFFDEACDFRGATSGFMLDGERTVAGVSVMKPESFAYLVQTGRGQPDDPMAAARILIDAQKRWEGQRETEGVSLLHVALLHGSPRPGSTWTTLEGVDIVVPPCSVGLSHGYPWELNDAASRHIMDVYQSAHARMTVEEVSLLYRALSDFQGLSRGLQYVGKYFAPAGFMRHDNYAAVRDLHFNALVSLVHDVSDRAGYGIESRGEEFFDDMTDLMRRLDGLKDQIREEVAKARKVQNEIGDWPDAGPDQPASRSPKF
ncbi:hypothetical protein [Rhizobium sp. BK176]|uniref:hypothetical protein n=1 Tax=Rhizobium sp. BK176 TaxID=2587071 RepID=UPI0021681811|nr:hypothetical protein [Rhizobium sp. BK176]MCS4088764.1 hypothetical protein [Rhizobium sp. BK176]